MPTLPPSPRPLLLAAGLVLALAAQAGRAPLSAQMAPVDTAGLIADALRAAPPAVARRATVMDLRKQVLRAGDSEWVCLPDDPDQAGDAPMCLDGAWLDFVGALMARRTPAIRRTGFGYMLQGDLPVSNTDPFASAPTAGNQWVENSGPHVMILFPDPAALDGLPTDPANGGPWVMWKGTPYAHVMVPVPRQRD